MIAALTNHLWQSTLFAAVVALLAVALRRNRPQVRYWLWLSASLKFLAPFSLLIRLGQQLQSVPAAQQLATQIVTPSVSYTAVYITQPFSENVAGTLPVSAQSAEWMTVLILSAWAIGFAAIALRRIWEWNRIRLLARASLPMDLDVDVPVRATDALIEPGVFGLLRPKLLLPSEILQRLTPRQLDAILAHELCHVTRRDNLTAAFHMLVEAIFWFHPLVWWIGARLVDERERACDEEVLRLGNEPLVYAERILNVCKVYQESPLACVSGVTGSDLKKRIDHIMRNSAGHHLSRFKALLLGMTAVVLLVGPVAAGVVRPRVLTALMEQVARPAAPEPVSAPSVRAATPVAPESPQTPPQIKDAFEVVSIRAAAPVAPRGFGPRGGGAGGDGAPLDPSAPSRRACGNGARLNPGRLDISNVTVYRLLTLAYGLHCRASLEVGLISGGSDWIQTQSFDIEATLPAGTPRYTFMQLNDGQAPRLQAMLQNMLAERFGLRLHRDSKQASLYNLVVVHEGKMTLAEDQAPLVPLVPGQANRGTSPSMPRGSLSFEADSSAGVLALKAWSVPINTLVLSMQGQNEHLVVDKTGLKGFYDFEVHLKVAPFQGDPGLYWPEIVQELGLKLEPARGPVEVLVIDRLEKPTEN